VVKFFDVGSVRLRGENIEVTRPKKALLSWSGGKDSAWTLHLLRRTPEVEVVGLLTTFNESANRVAIHGVRQELVSAQSQAAGLPLFAVPLPSPCSNSQYEATMRRVCDDALASGVTAIAFGDLFLADIRAYREKQLQDTGLQPLFPIWGLPTLPLARQMIASGLRAKLSVVDSRVLAADFSGSDFDAQLLADLPGGVDPCGENGEFHSFVYAGPMFQNSIPMQVGKRVSRDGFIFTDLLPK